MRGDAVENSDKTVQQLIKPEQIQGGFDKLRRAINGLAENAFDVKEVDAAALKISLSFHSFAELLEQCLVLAKDTKTRTARSIRLGKVLVKFQNRNSKRAQEKLWKKLLLKTKADLENSELRAGQIYDALNKLNQDLVAIKAQFETAVSKMTGYINKRMEEEKARIQAQKAQAIKDMAKCGWAEAIFSLGIACAIKANKAKKALEELNRSGPPFVKWLVAVAEDFQETKRVLGMCTALMESTQNQRMMMNEFKGTIKQIIEGVIANLDSLSDLCDPDIGPDMIQMQFDDWGGLITECDMVTAKTLERRDDMLKILNNNA